jgi:hypothetical protein
MQEVKPVLNFTYEPQTWIINGEEVVNEFLIYQALKHFNTDKGNDFLDTCLKKGDEQARLERLTGNEQEFGEYELFCLGLRALANS